MDAREAAPAAVAQQNLTKKDIQSGWPSIGVPGELMGYWMVHQQFGSIPWKELWRPTIQLAKDGFFVSNPLAKALAHPFVHSTVLNESTMRYCTNTICIWYCIETTK